MSSWTPVDLSEVIANRVASRPPTILNRSDGVSLLYDGKDHALYGEPESCKSLLAAYVVASRAQLNDHTLWVDFEEDGGSFVTRLRALGLDDEHISTFCHYVCPEEPIDDSAFAEMANVLEKSTVAIIDGVNLGLALHGLDSSNNADVAEFHQRFVRRLHRYGEIATLQIDHVTKAKDDRGRYPIGAQQKLGLVDVALGLRALRPFGRGREGELAIRLHKDRGGYLRGYQGADGELARVHLASLESGQVRIDIHPPPEDDESSAGGFRPTYLMERISRAVEAEPGLNKRSIRSIPGNNAAKDAALRHLIEEGFFRVEAGSGGNRHYSERPYREAGGGEGGVPKACPSDFSEGVPPVPPRAYAVPRGSGHASDAPVPTCPPPLGGARGTASQPGINVPSEQPSFTAPVSNGYVPLATAEEEERAARLGVALYDDGEGA